VVLQKENLERANDVTEYAKQSRLRIGILRGRPGYMNGRGDSPQSQNKMKKRNEFESALNIGSQKQMAQEALKKLKKN